MIENKTSESRNNEQSDCDCAECSWIDEENMITGTFRMPKDLYEKIEKARGNGIEQLSCESKSSEVFYGRQVAAGVLHNLERQKATRALKIVVRSVVVNSMTSGELRDEKCDGKI